LLPSLEHASSVHSHLHHPSASIVPAAASAAAHPLTEAIVRANGEAGHAETDATQTRNAIIYIAVSALYYHNIYDLYSRNSRELFIRFPEMAGNFGQIRDFSSFPCFSSIYLRTPYYMSLCAASKLVIWKL
jgi:hypothetical protein